MRGISTHRPATRSVVLTIAALLACTGIASAKDIKYHDWSGKCEGKTVCFVQMGSKGPRLLLGWNKTEQALRVGALVPAAVGVNQAVTIWVDDDYSVFLATNSCTKDYCEAMVDAAKTQAVINTLKKAGSGVLVFPEAGHIQVSPISLRGFSKAYAAVVKGTR